MNKKSLVFWKKLQIFRANWIWNSEQSFINWIKFQLLFFSCAQTKFTNKWTIFNYRQNVGKFKTKQKHWIESVHSEETYCSHVSSIVFFPISSCNNNRFDGCFFGNEIKWVFDLSVINHGLRIYEFLCCENWCYKIRPSDVDGI